MLARLSPWSRRVSTCCRMSLSRALGLLVEPGRERARFLAAMAVGLVFAIDTLLARGGEPRAIEALLDEPAHAATALLFLAALRPRPLKGHGLGVVLGAVLIDVDHVPMGLGWDVLTRGTNRPYSHSLLTLIGVMVVASCLRGGRRQLAFAVAFGLAAHLVRDMATGGVPLFWPSAARVRLPYGAYTAILLAAVALAAWRARADTVDRPSVWRARRDRR